MNKLAIIGHDIQIAINMAIVGGALPGIVKPLIKALNEKQIKEATEKYNSQHFMENSYLATPKFYRHIADSNYHEVSDLVSFDGHFKMKEKLRRQDDQVYLNKMIERIKSMGGFSLYGWL